MVHGPKEADTTGSPMKHLSKITVKITVNKPLHRIFNKFPNILLLYMCIYLIITRQLRKPLSKQTKRKQLTNYAE